MTKPEWRHRVAGKARWFDPFDGVRERRARGTRLPLDLYYNLRLYLIAFLIPWALFWGGVDLYTKESPWQKVVAVLVFGLTAMLVAWFVRWLLKPVDIDALRRQRERRDSLKLSSIFGRKNTSDR